MSIASELTALNGYILGAYDEIDTKGGTVPANKNMANLASAIGSISTGSSTTITPLNVTENGTYTAPTGTAYSPVTVNVSGGGSSDNNWAEVMRGESTGLYDNTLAAISNFAYIVGNASQYTDVAEATFHKIKTASFPEVLTIGNYALQNWRSLQSISLPKCSTVGMYAFYYDTSLTSINAPSLTMVNERSFKNCTALVEFDQPLADTYVSEVWGVELYVQEVFCNCSVLAKVRLKPTKGIGASTFSGCKALKTLILLSESLIGLGNTNAFTNTPIASGTGYIYVRKSLVDSFKTADKWSTYANQIRAIEDYSDDGTVNGDINV